MISHREHREHRDQREKSGLQQKLCVLCVLCGKLFLRRFLLEAAHEAFADDADF